jgi:hypothetical protein
MANYSTVYGNVASVSPFYTTVSDRSCSLLISVNTQSMGQINFVVTPQTFVLEQHTFGQGEPIIGIYDTSVPVPLIYPPQYRAVVLAQNSFGYRAALNYFDEDLLSVDQTMKLNIPTDGSTQILLVNGQNFVYNPGDHYLFILYMSDSMSTPAEVTPQKIIVFCNTGE